MRVYQFRHIRASAKSEDIARAHAFCGGGSRQLACAVRGTAAGVSRSRLSASLEPFIRAAIVQGTRTPPSHGGNPGSNPGSGTYGTPAKRGFVVLGAVGECLGEYRVVELRLGACEPSAPS